MAIKNFNFDSKKFGILLFMVCFVFFVLIIKAFDYLPDENVVVSDVTRSTETIDNTQSEVNDESSDAEDTLKRINSKNTKAGVKRILMASKDDTEEEQTQFDEIDAPEGVNQDSLEPISNSDNNSDSRNLTNEQLAATAIFAGRKYKQDGDYSKALSEFQKVANLTSDKELVATSYEGIAELYAITRKFGTALTFANKAYNLSPSSAREMLIAKIYYKAGETDKAVNGVNNILKKGF